MASLLTKIPPGSAFKKVSCVSNNPARYAGQSHHIGRLSRAEARFLLIGGEYYQEYRRHKPCRGVGVYHPPENFQIWRLRNAIFGACHEICFRKINLEYENGKQLQVIIIMKITESKENKSIHRLDVKGLGGQLPPPLPPC